VVSVASSGTTTILYAGTVRGAPEPVFLLGFVQFEMVVVRDSSWWLIARGCEPSAQLHVEISKVFGPLKDHPTKTTARVDKLDPNSAPGVIDMRRQPPSL